MPDEKSGEASQPDTVKEQPKAQEQVVAHKDVPPLSPQTAPGTLSTGFGKDVREWASLVISLIALATSWASYRTSISSSKLEQRKYDAERAIVLVAEKMKDELPKDELFRFHALQPNQHITHLQITVPSEFGSRSWGAQPPDQLLSLTPIDDQVAQYFKKDAAVETGYAAVVEARIPVVLDAEYSVDGETVDRRGVYTLSTEMVVTDKEYDTPRVNFLDFGFMYSADINEDPQKIVDAVWQEAKNEVHKPQRKSTPQAPKQP
jgi:hypothetical protein